MSAQDIFLGERVAHVRELKAEVAALKAENAALRDENAALKAHFDMALLAASDLRALAEDGRQEIWDGWNLILGAQKAAHDRGELVAEARARVQASAGRLCVWIVLDGPDEKVRVAEGVRVSYTGGTGEQRADRFICDYLRMARYLGLANRVSVRTNDKELLKSVSRLQS